MSHGNTLENYDQLSCEYLIHHLCRNMFPTLDPAHKTRLVKAATGDTLRKIFASLITGDVSPLLGFLSSTPVQQGGRAEVRNLMQTFGFDKAVTGKQELDRVALTPAPSVTLAPSVTSSAPVTSSSPLGLTDSTIEAYLSCEDSGVALNFLRTMIFFEGSEATRDEFIAEFKSASPELREGLVSNIISNARHI